MIPKTIEQQMQEKVAYIKTRASALDRFAPKAPAKAMETATELLISGLAAQHFTILPNSEVVIDVEGLYSVVITEDEDDAVMCDICFDSSLIQPAMPSVLFFKAPVATTLLGSQDRLRVEPHELSDDIKAFFALLCAAVVRDFWVLEHKARQRVYQTRTQKVKERVGTGKDRHVVITKSHIYLPRFQYSLSDYESDNHKVSEEARVTLSPHLVSGHIRRLPEGHQPSKQSKNHAAEYGIKLPDGGTFVRPHEKGKSERLLTYRSRSAFEILFSIESKKR